jgi:hypothetical protein
MAGGLFSVRAAVDARDVFPCNLLCLAVEAATDFDRRGLGDDQLRDKDTGERVWNVRCMDPNPEASKFGRVPAVTVKVTAPHQPVPPPAPFPGMPPLVSFEGMTVTPYLSNDKCKAPKPGEQHRCRAQVAYSVYATAMVDPLESAS